LRTRSRAEEDRKLVSPLPPRAPVFCAHVPRRRRRCRRRRRTDPLFLFVGAQSIVAAAAAPLFNLSFHAICNKGTNGVAPFRGVHGDPGPPASFPRSFLPVALIFLETSAERHSAA